MQSECEDFGRTLEELPDCFPAFEPAQRSTLPNSVLYEKLGYFVGVIVVVTVCYVPCFQVRLRLQGCGPYFEARPALGLTLLLDRLPFHFLRGISTTVKTHSNRIEASSPAFAVLFRY